MAITRALGVLCLALSLEYVRFFFLRQQAFTVVQMATLVCAGLSLLVQTRGAPNRPVWFRGPLPTCWQGWALLASGLALAVGVFLVVDHGSHSVSDTVYGIVPTGSLLLALGARLYFERAAAQV